MTLCMWFGFGTKCAMHAIIATRFQYCCVWIGGGITSRAAVRLVWCYSCSISW
jgi:hypothetical protein